jgi:glycosyltransferase involved in cell wall biosynthesis
MNLPKISLITPSFNQVRFIEATFESVFRQNYPNLEYIVMDGGSTDGTVDIIKRYSDRFAYWVSESDRGQTDALVKGFDRATGDIFCWLCSDDILEPNTLHEVAQFFQSNADAQFVYGDTIWIDDYDRLIKYRKETNFNQFIFLYEHNFIPQPSAFWRRDLYKQVGGLNPTFNMAMDTDMWMRCAQVTELHHVRRYWSRMRLYAEQKTQRLKSTTPQEDQKIRQRYYGDEPDWSFRAKKMYAKSLRLTWKLSTGCYW